jgi:hypothetical protein
MKKDIKEYVGEKFIYKNQIWLCTGYEGCDMFDFVSEVTNEKITIPYTWGKFIMCNIENEIKDIHDWIIENKDNLEIFSWNNNTRMKVAMNVHDLYLSVIFKKDTESNIFKNYYDIDTINDVKTNGRYKKYSKDIEKIWNILMNIDNEQRQSLEGKKIREEIDKLVNCNDYDKEFEFGEPNHKENLPDFDLKVGETYLVPMKLLEKERSFDGGRGTEHYKFHYTTGTYGYRPFTIPDYHMTKEIRKKEDEKS